jgi:hypothetical protein
VFQFESDKLLLCLDDFVFLDYFGFSLRLAEDSFAMYFEDDEADKRSNQYTYQSYYCI